MMKTRLLFLLLPLLAGCATASEVATTVAVGGGVITADQKHFIDQTAAKAEKAARPMTEKEEYYIGRGVAARIFARYVPYDDPETVSYVNHVGRALVINSTRPYTYGGYHFAVLDSDEINAFACPGGIIFVTRGMLKLVRTEDELAAVLAHELSHVTQKHGLQAISKARWTEVVTTAGTGAVSEYSGAQLNSLINLFEGSIDDVFKTLVVRGYGREDEHEADTLALHFLESSGYNPHGLLNLLAELEEAKSHSSGGIFSTHPDLEDRMTEAKNTPQALQERPLSPERLARFARVARHW